MKKVSLLLAFVLLAVLAYYSIEIAIAHKATPSIKNDFINDSKIDITFDDLSDRQQKIFIRVQDPNFWNHKGVEFSTPGSGWTTITQSIAKWFYFDPFKPGIRKIKQTLLARFVLNYRLSKEEQLLVFLNHIWFDDKVVGYRDAALHFYNKAVDELSEDEFISLVAMHVAPRTYNIVTNPANNRTRTDRIKRLISGAYQPKGLFDIYYDK